MGNNGETFYFHHNNNDAFDCKNENLFMFEIENTTNLHTSTSSSNATLSLTLFSASKEFDLTQHTELQKIHQKDINWNILVDQVFR